MLDNKFALSNLVDPIFSTPDDFSHWFGYYNISPVDLSGNKLLAHRTNFDARAITSDDIAEIGWFDILDGSWHSLGKTNAFNWQQGSMLQWFGKQRNEIIFNDAVNGRFVSRIINIDGIKERQIPWPVYGITSDGQTSISLQFERSYWCRAYHYESISNQKWNVQVADDDGVFRVNMQDGSVDRIISINDIINYDYDPIFETSKHWLEHIMLNPSGDRFAFYHRFSHEKGFRTRIFTANIDGSDIFIVPGWRDNLWSHMGWRSDSDFVVFGIKRLLAGKTYERITNCGVLGNIVKYAYRTLISPFVSKRVHTKIAASSNYQHYIDKQGFVGGYSKGMLINDGHPSFTPDGFYMLTDTYEDSESYRHLLLYDVKNDELFELGKFYSPFNSFGYRCDLHPRFSPDFKYIIIDTAHTGRHQMMVLKIRWELLQ